MPLLPDPLPAVRLRVALDRPPRADGDFVLYWMIAARRARWSFALQHAVRRAAELGRPLLVLEAIRAGHRFNTARVHRFVLDGMAANQRRFAAAGVTHHAFVEPAPGAGRGLLAALSRRACLVVTDDSPTYDLRSLVAAAAGRVDARLEAVDGGGLMPLASTDRVYSTAASFRRALHKVAEELTDAFPAEDPLASYGGGWARVPANVAKCWPASPPEALLDPAVLSGLPLDHDVPPVAGLTGGSEAGEARAGRFLDERLADYSDASRHPDGPGTSGLSPYLHFGHVGVHGLLDALLRAEEWHPGRIQSHRVGARSGFWGLSEAAESWLDQLVTWRELGAVFTHHRGDDLQRYDALPGWALKTLGEHAADERPWRYDRAALQEAATHEPLWNACQRQLRAEGVIHSYLRMLWAKMVLGWSPHPQVAFETLLELNDRWAIDGRDPNGWAGVSWCFGRFDRAWGPERAVFGKVRYMTCEASRRKLRLARYLQRWSAP